MDARLYRWGTVLSKKVVLDITQEDVVLKIAQKSNPLLMCDYANSPDETRKMLMQEETTTAQKRQKSRVHKAKLKAAKEEARLREHAKKKMNAAHRYLTHKVKQVKLRLNSMRAHLSFLESKYGAMPKEIREQAIASDFEIITQRANFEQLRRNYNAALEDQKAGFDQVNKAHDAALKELKGEHTSSTMV